MIYIVCLGKLIAVHCSVHFVEQQKGHLASTKPAEVIPKCSSSDT